MWYSFDPFINIYSGLVAFLHFTAVVYNVVKESYAESWPLVFSTSLICLGCLALAFKKNMKTSLFSHRALGLFLLMQIGNVVARGMRYSHKFTSSDITQNYVVLVVSCVACAALLHLFLWQRISVKQPIDSSFSPELGSWRLTVFQFLMHAVGVLLFTCGIGRLNYAKVPCPYTTDAMLNLAIFANVYAQTYFKRFRQSFRGTIVNLSLTAVSMLLLVTCCVLYIRAGSSKPAHGLTTMSLFFYIVATTACVLTMFYKAAILEEPVFFSRTKTSVVMVKNSSVYEGKKTQRLESQTTFNDADNAVDAYQAAV